MRGPGVEVEKGWDVTSVWRSTQGCIEVNQAWMGMGHLLALRRDGFGASAAGHTCHMVLEWVGRVNCGNLSRVEVD